MRSPLSKEEQALFDLYMKKLDDIDAKEDRDRERGIVRGLDSPYDAERKKVVHELNEKMKALWGAEGRKIEI